MSKHVLKDGTIITVTHTMADGTVRDSVAGYEIPFNDTTYPAYYLLAEAKRRKLERMAREASPDV